MKDTEFTVILDRAVDEALEHLLSPMDELEFLSQLDNQLPRVHQPAKRSFLSRLQWPSLHIYRGLAEWCGVHFHYVQFDNHLHILRFEPSCDDDRHQAVTLLGEPDSEGVSIVEVEDGISIASY